MNPLDTEVYSVIVCYSPDVLCLAKLCRRILDSHCRVVLVDNSENSSIEGNLLFTECVVIALGTNRGIACAQNIGVKYAADLGAEAVVFFDQDSSIDNGFLVSLLEPLAAKVPGIVAPVYYEDETGLEYPSFRVTRFGFVKKLYREAQIAPYPVDIVISSGMAVTVEVFQLVGYMDAGLFIDFVDTEWCLRCRKYNVPIHVVPAAIMTHSIGIGAINFYFLTIIVHSQTRCYYQIRNCFHLFRKDSIPFFFAVKELTSVLLNKLLLLIFVRNRVAYVASYLAAIQNGIQGVEGKWRD